MDSMWCDGFSKKKKNLICELDAPKKSERPRDHAQVAQDRIPVQPARAIPADRQARIAARQDDAESLELLTSVLRCGWAGDGGIGRILV